MIWLTWRQHRTELIISSIVLALIIIVLLITRANIIALTSDLFHNTNATICAPQKLDCSKEYINSYNVAGRSFGSMLFFTLFRYMFLALPVFVGMFIGARLVTQEFEQGTFRLVWTQGVRWPRWLGMKIALLTVFWLCAAGVLLGALLWWRSVISMDPWGYLNYDICSPVLIAYTIFSLALGIAAGSIFRKMLPAVAVTLVVFVALRIVIEVFLRPYLLPPLTVVQTASLTQTISLPRQSLSLSYTVLKHGQLSSITGEEEVCDRPLSKGETTQEYSSVYNQCLAEHGFQDKETYQPGDRFWLFQGMESGIYLLFAALSIGIAFWATRRSLT